MQCFAIACLISVCWVTYGYSLAFRGAGSFIGDFSSLFLNDVGRDSLSGTLPETVFIKAIIRRVAERLEVDIEHLVKEINQAPILKKQNPLIEPKETFKQKYSTHFFFYNKWL